MKKQSSFCLFCCLECNKRASERAAKNICRVGHKNIRFKIKWKECSMHSTCIFPV